MVVSSPVESLPKASEVTEAFGVHPIKTKAAHNSAKAIRFIDKQY
jgi:hypothetical protein